MYPTSQFTPGVNNPVWPVPDSGGSGLEPGGVVTYTYASTISITPAIGAEHKITTVDAVGNATLNAASVLGAGARTTVSITNDATSSKTITFGTSFLSAGNVIGVVGQTITVQFISDGISWIESGRAVALEQLPNTLDTMAYGATISLVPSAGRVHQTTTVNATGNATINATAVQPPGYDMLVIVTNDATSAKVITFGTNFVTVGVLVGIVNQTATIQFVSNGTSWIETGRAVTQEYPPNTLDTMTYAKTISLDPTVGRVHKTTTVYSTGSATINATSVLPSGYDMFVAIANDPSWDETITFGTNFVTTGVLVGNTNKTAVIHFISDGVNWIESSRTVVLLQAPNTIDNIGYSTTMTLYPTNGRVHRIYATSTRGAATINAASVQPPGYDMIVEMVNNTTSSQELTFGTNFLTMGVLIGTVSKTATVFFVSDGGNWIETSRVTAGDFVPGAVDVMTYAATITLDPSAGRFHQTTTVDATGNATINALSLLVAGTTMQVWVSNDATSAKTITFGTNFRPAGVLTGTISKVAILSFISDGISWYESARQTGL